MRTYIDFMIDEANEAHNVDLRNLPATAPLFAYLHAASLGAVECKYKHVALELAKLAAAYYLQTAEADDRWYGFATETCEGEEAGDIIHDWANAERNKYSYGLHNGARGTHDVDLMSNIVKELREAGMKDAWIMKHLGMDADELLRLKQITGLAALFKDREFSASWDI